MEKNIKGFKSVEPQLTFGGLLGLVAVKKAFAFAMYHDTSVAAELAAGRVDSIAHVGETIVRRYQLIEGGFDHANNELGTDILFLSRKRLRNLADHNAHLVQVMSGDAEYLMGALPDYVRGIVSETDVDVRHTETLLLTSNVLQLPVV